VCFASRSGVLRIQELGFPPPLSGATGVRREYIPKIQFGAAIYRAANVSAAEYGGRERRKVSRRLADATNEAISACDARGGGEKRRSKIVVLVAICRERGVGGGAERESRAQLRQTTLGEGEVVRLLIYQLFAGRSTTPVNNAAQRYSPTDAH
jgi:hypothetical protein